MHHAPLSPAPSLDCAYFPSPRGCLLIPNGQTYRRSNLRQRALGIQDGLGFPLSEVGRRIMQHFSNFSGQLLGTIWLLYERHLGIENPLPGDGVVGVTGREDYFYSGAMHRDLAGQFTSAHLRHHDIGQQEINGSSEVFGARNASLPEAASRTV